MIEWVRLLFDANDFVPRWSCGNWGTLHGWVHIVADGLIFLAYFAIPASLGVVLWRRRDFPFPLVLGLFVAFILSCGLTHLVETMMFFRPMYRLSAAFKVATAAVSLATAFVLVRSMPLILAMPGALQKNQELAREIDRGRGEIRELSSARDSIEKRTAMLTSRLRRVSEAFAAARTVACRWKLETGEIEWEVGYDETARRAGLVVKEPLKRWEGLIGAAGWEAMRAASLEAARDGSVMQYDSPEIAEGVRMRLAASADPTVEGQPRTMTGMFRFLRRAPGPETGGTSERPASV